MGERLRRIGMAVGIATATGAEPVARASDIYPGVDSAHIESKIAELPDQLERYVVSDIGTEAKRFLKYLQDPDVVLTASEQGTTNTAPRVDLEVMGDDISRWMFNPTGAFSQSDAATAIFWTPGELARMSESTTPSRLFTETAKTRMMPQDGLPFYFEDTTGLVSETNQRAAQLNNDPTSPFIDSTVQRDEKRALALSLIEAVGYTGPLLHLLHEEQLNTTVRETQKTSTSREQVSSADVVKAAYAQTKIYVDYLVTLAGQESADVIPYVVYREYMQRLATLSEYQSDAGLVDVGYDEYPQLATAQADVQAYDAENGGQIQAAVKQLQSIVEKMKTRVDAKEREAFLKKHDWVLDQQAQAWTVKLSVAEEDGDTGRSGLSKEEKAAVEETIRPDLR